MSLETKQTSPSPSMKNRRFYSRRDVRSLAYVDLGRDNGGIVLNVSEGGLAIHSAIVLKDRRLAHVRFQLPQSTEWIEARGEVAWTSESKMQAGIQLVGLTDNARKQIRDWVGVTIRPASVEMPRTVLAERRPLNSLRVQPLPTPAMPPDPPVPGTVRKSTRPNEQTVAKPSETGQSPSGLVAPPGRSNGSPQTTQKTLALPNAVRPSTVGTQLGLRLGQTASRPQSRPAWVNWVGFAVLSVGMAALSFAAGLRTGTGDSRSLVDGLFNSGTRSDSASASQPSDVNLGAMTPLVGRVTISSRLYVPVSIPARPDEAREDRLQVGSLTYHPEPQYPADAQRQHTEGTVQLRATIGTSGSVENVTVLSGPATLVEAASNAVRQWRFKPTQLDGKAIETEADVAIVFWLRPAAPHPQTQSK